jgi:hypothetical protein
MSDVINFQDAKAMKAMGWPLATPVEHVTVSPKVAKHWTAIHKADTAYLKALDRYIKKPNGLRFKTSISKCSGSSVRLSRRTHLSTRSRAMTMSSQPTLPRR